MKRLLSIVSLLMAIICMLPTSASAFSGSDLSFSTYLNTPNNYASQNCYGYSLGLLSNVDPGYFSNTSYSTKVQFKNCVLADLTALGYTCFETTSPTYTLSYNQFLLAYCIGTWTGTLNGITVETNNLAYHFWRKNYGNSGWKHKFGTSSGIMRFNYVPKSSNRQYTSNEYYNGITGGYSLPTMFPANSGPVWIYIVVTDTSKSPNALALQRLEQLSSLNDDCDHSAAAQIEALLKDHR